MFKFMKSKKGFTLVELMIVVVIMAILVAVAVPIFSAVTANARKKTCVGNQRNIVSQITNQVMSGGAAANDGTIVVKTNAKGDKLDSVTDNGVFKVSKTEGTTTSLVADSTGETFKSFFSADNMPICPVAYGQLTVSVDAGTDGSCTVKVYCNSDDKMSSLPASGTTMGNLSHAAGN